MKNETFLGSYRHRGAIRGLACFLQKLIMTCNTSRLKSLDMVCGILYILKILGGVLEDGKRLEGIEKLFASSVIFFLIISGGCVKNAVKNVPDEESLRDRIVTYWDHKVKEEFDKCYAFEDPLFRKKITMVNYIKSFNTTRAKWVGAEVEDIKVADDTAKVMMKIKMSIPVSSGRDVAPEASIEEKWVKVDGLWYHIPRKAGVQQSDHNGGS